VTERHDIKQGGTIIVYTYEQGGIMHVSPWWGSREDFEKAKETGWLVAKPYADVPSGVPLAMVAFCEVVELHDFQMPVPT
jgi:hypothetical protein